MARLFLMMSESAAPGTLIKQLRAAGHRLIVAEPRYPDFFNLLRQQTEAPELFVVDCSRLANHARESANYVRGLRAHQSTPFILFNVRLEDEGKCREKVPGAVLVRDGNVLPAVEAVLRNPARPSPG